MYPPLQQNLLGEIWRRDEDVDPENRLGLLADLVVHLAAECGRFLQLQSKPGLFGLVLKRKVRVTVNWDGTCEEHNQPGAPYVREGRGF